MRRRPRLSNRHFGSERGVGTGLTEIHRARSGALERAPVETNPTRMCQLLVDLPDVHVIGIDKDPGQPMRVPIETPDGRPGCPTCGVFARSKDRDVVELVDLPSYGRPRRLVWHKRRRWCADADCAVKTFTEEEHRIAAPRMAMTDRAGRWVTEQVGRRARSVERDRHRTRLRLAHGERRRRPLRRGPGRRARPLRRRQALGLDEVLFVRVGPSTARSSRPPIADVERGQLLDVVPGRSGKGADRMARGKGLRPGARRSRWCTLDLSGPYRAVFDEDVPDATQVADPFHVMKLANTKLDECRRRVQNETMGHRGRKTTPSTGAGACSPRPTNASTTKDARSCSACSAPATPRAR